jgi:hypothetical protein
MDNIQRLIFVFTIFFSSFVQANTGSGGYQIYPAASSSTPQGACTNWGSINNANPLTVSFPYCVNSSGVTYTNYPILTNPDCPSGQTFLDSTNACGVSAPPCVGGNTVSTGYYDLGTNPSTPPSSGTCDGSCGSHFEGSSPAARKLVNGIFHYYAVGFYVSESFACTASNTSPTSPTSVSATPTDTCATGQTLGQVNGVNTCLAAGKPTDPNAPVPAATTGTKSAPVTNADNSVTTTTTTTNKDNSITTTTTTVKPDGSTSTTSTTTGANGNSTDPLTGFCAANPSSPMCGGQNPICKDNPELSICKKSSVSASCGGFTCDGDAVQCQIAQEQYTKNCVLFTTATTQSKLANNIANGLDPMQTQIDLNQVGTTTDMPTVFRAAQGSRWLTSTDLPNVNITALGHNYVMDTSLLSNFMRIVGYILVSIAGVLAIRSIAQ